MVRFADSDEVRPEVVATIEAGLQRFQVVTDASGDIKPWYHDSPIWMFVPTGEDEDNRHILQASVVQDFGQQWIEISCRREDLWDGAMETRQWSRREEAETLTVDIFAAHCVTAWHYAHQGEVY